jgi:hypothetical protein
MKLQSSEDTAFIHLRLTASLPPTCSSHRRSHRSGLYNPAIFAPTAPHHPGEFIATTTSTNWLPPLMYVLLNTCSSPQIGCWLAPTPSPLPPHGHMMTILAEARRAQMKADLHRRVHLRSMMENLSFGP